MTALMGASNRAMNSAYDALQDVHDNLDMRNPIGVKTAAEALLAALGELEIEVEAPALA